MIDYLIIWLLLFAVSGGVYFLMRHWPLGALAVALVFVAAVPAFGVSVTAFGIDTVSARPWRNESHLLIYIVSAVQAAIPAVVLLLLAYAATQFAHYGIKWAILVTGTGVFSLAWPIISIYVVCVSGIDCL